MFCLKRLQEIRHKEIPQHFSTNVMFFRLAGLWIPHQNEEFATKFLNYSFNIFIFCTAAPLVILETCNLPISLKHDATLFTKNVGYVIYHLMALVKVIFWVRNREILFDALNKLDNFKHIYHKYIVGEKNKSDMYQEDFLPDKIMFSQKVLSDVAIIILVGNVSGMILSAILTMTYPFFFDNEQYFVEIADEHNVSHVLYLQPLYLQSTMPFDYQTGRFAFFWAGLYQLYGLGYFITITISFDGLFASLMSFVCVHLMIVQGAFITIRQRCVCKLKITDNDLYSADSPILQDEMMKEARKCVQHLKQIFITTETLENMFTYLTFGQLGLSLGGFCTSLYIVSSLPIGAQLGFEICYLTSILCELMLFCYFGHSVTINADNMPDAIYKSDWLRANISFKRTLLITMIRMTKTIHFTIGKFSPLLLSTFVTICRASYSFFTMLKSMSSAEST